MRTLPALAGLLLALAATCCHGHGFLEVPLSRARTLNYAVWEAAGGNGLGNTPFPKYSDGNLRNDQADVCGDPHQQVGDMNLRGRAGTIQATYASGSIISVTFKITVNHGGWLGLRICPSTRVNPSQSCFDGNILVNDNTGTQRWWITSGSYEGGEHTYVTRWRLPAGVSCDGGCVMQMVYRTANSCVDPCPASECGSAYAARNNPVTRQNGLSACASIGTSMVGSGQTPRSEIFRDCADIRITGGGGGGSSSSTNCPAVNGFTASANIDFNGNDIRQAGTTTATAAAACAANPWCRGFNSNGWIKHSLPSQSTVQGLCFYRRTVQPGGPAHGMTVSIGTGTNRQGCIDVPWNNKAAGVVLHQWECNGGSAQRWYLEHAGNGWYRVKATNNLCMGVRESRTTSGTDVLLWGCSNINDQLFAFVWNSARGAYTMRPAHASSMCVDISSSSTANGARVQIWTCNDSAAQMFSLAP